MMPPEGWTAEEVAYVQRVARLYELRAQREGLLERKRQLLQWLRAARPQIARHLFLEEHAYEVSMQLAQVEVILETLESQLAQEGGDAGCDV